MADPRVDLRITAQDQTRAAIQSVRQGLNALSKQIGALRSQTLAIGAAFVAFQSIVRPLANLAREAIDTGDELLALSQRTGITVEQLSALSHAAKLSNSDINTVATGAKRLATNLLEAATGSEKAQKLLSAFGVTAEDDLLSAFAKISERLKELPDGWQKNALAVKLFGRAGDQLVPFLNELGAGLDDAQRKNLIFYDISILGWIKRTGALPNRDPILGKSNGNFWDYLLYFRNDNSFVSFFASPNGVILASTTAITDDQWHHVAFTRIGSACSMYVDGKVDTTGTHSTGFGSNLYPITLGRQSAASEGVDGFLDDIRLYNRGLSRTEIAISAAGWSPLSLREDLRQAGGAGTLLSLGNIYRMFI